MAKYTQTLTIIILLSLLTGCSERPLIKFRNFYGKEIIVVANKEHHLKNGEEIQFLWRSFTIKIDGSIYIYEFTKYPPSNFIKDEDNKKVIVLELRSDKTINIDPTIAQDEKSQPQGFPLTPRN
jgi:hypothetical protein